MAVQQVLTKAISENSASDDLERKGKAQKLKEMFDSVLSSYNASPGKLEGIKNVIEEFTPMEREQIDTKIQEAKEYIKTASSDKLSMDKMQTAFKEILNDPKTITSLISNNFKEFDREQIITLLDDNTNMKRDEIESYAEQVESTVKRMVKEFDKNNDERLVKRMEMKVANFFDTTGREELDYSILKNDLKRVMDNPKDSLDIIQERFSTLDNNTLRAIVTNNKYIKEEDIDKVLDTVDSSKNEVLDKITQIQTKANQQIESTKRKAVVQAENARATTASAAWWLVVTSILSAVAAIGGGFVSL